MTVRRGRMRLRICNPALRAATAGTTIDVAQGTYKPTTDTNRNATIQLIDGVTLEGGFRRQYRALIRIFAIQRLRRRFCRATSEPSGTIRTNSYSVVNGGEHGRHGGPPMGSLSLAEMDDVDNIGQAGGGD